MDDIPRLNSKAVFSPFTKGRKRKKPEPEPEPPAPDPQVPETCDKQIMRAMGVLANAIRKAVIEANESTTSAARKAELEAWIERNETEISGRIHRLARFVGLGVDPEKDKELGDLLKDTEVPPYTSGD